MRTMPPPMMEGGHEQLAGGVEKRRDPAVRGIWANWVTASQASIVPAGSRQAGCGSGDPADLTPVRAGAGAAHWTGWLKFGMQA